MNPKIKELFKNFLDQELIVPLYAHMEQNIAKGIEVSANVITTALQPSSPEKPYSPTNMKLFL